MPFRSHLLLSIPMICSFVSSPLPCWSAEIRDRAVVSLTFDDMPASGPALAADRGKAGKADDAATLSQQPSRVPSAFVAGSGGYSLILDPARTQQVVIPNSDDTSRPDAVTVSGFFASLHPLSDAVFHGLFAKRRPTDPAVTNYGINFQPSTDNFQVYLNDGSGYKVVNYSVKATIGYRRRVHLAVSFDQGDAPGADADADADDVRVRLFINGQLATPTKATGGLVEGAAGWLQDAALAKCVSDTPVTIGSSFTNGELTRLICDEFHLFAEALSDDDAKALFAEVAGASAEEISRDQGATTDAGSLQPQVVRIAPHSAEAGKTTRMIVTGQRLENARLHTDVSGISAAVAEGGNAGQGVFDVTVNESVASGRYLVRCVTPHGVSSPLIISVDHVPTQPDGTFTEANPATMFPIAVTGLISGTEQKRLWFRGTANQRIAVEVEARRVGSKLDPVVEIHSQSGTPLGIQWQQPELGGDARVTTVLPGDGLYFAELHDLQYRAQGASPWRLMLGDLPPAALAFPATVAASGATLRTVGEGVVSEPVSVKAVGGRVSIESGTALLPLPALRVDAGTQVTEPLEGTFAATPVDAAFTASPFPPLLVNGRISAAKEQDSILLTVTPGQTLHFSVAAQSLSSPLRARLMLYNGDALVAQDDGQSGAADPMLAFAVPEGVTQLRVQISDVNHQGSVSSVYRLQVARVDRQAFVISTSDGALRLPLNGSVPLRLSVVRQSPSFRYTGPIRLSLSGSEEVEIVPEVIPASDQNQNILAMVTRKASVAADIAVSGQGLTIEARAVGAEPVFSTMVLVETSGLPSNALTLPDSTVVAGPSDMIPATVLPDEIPPILLRGIDTIISVRVIPLVEQIPQFVRFEMTTTEPARREDPNKPDSPLKPVVSLEEFQFGQVSEGVFSLQVRVPFDTPSSVIDAVISADFSAQPLAPPGASKAWTAPIVLFVDDAAVLTAPAEPVRGTKNAKVVVSGSLQRHPLFTEPVTVVVEGLPQGYAAAPVTVPADQTVFSVEVSIPETAAAGEVPNLTLQPRHANGNTIGKPVALRLVIE